MTAITVLYTANLRANLETLPRVATQLQHIRQSYGVNPPPFLILDLGGAWSAEQWVSVVTEHRAPYLILDAMGYSVVHADGLNVGGILGLQEVVQTRLIDATISHRWQRRDMTVHIGNKGPRPRIGWSNTPATPTTFYEHQPQQLLLHPPTHAIGHLNIDYPNLNVLVAHYTPIDPTVRPDPTIVATIDYVAGEARAYAQKQQKENPPLS